jgi:hypothetical protein
MQQTEIAQATWIRPEDTQMSLGELRAWDWRAELTKQDRGMTWLARKTERSVSAVYRYSDGSLTPPESWLREVAQLLGVERGS